MDISKAPMILELYLDSSRNYDRSLQEAKEALDLLRDALAIAERQVKLLRSTIHNKDIALDAHRIEGEQLKTDIDYLSRLLLKVQNAITYDSEEEAKASPYGLPRELALEILNYLENCEIGDSDVPTL